ncbi:Uncharacterized protein Rs2_40951 [Raphanus sativus]|nr:Uncharacterized protein Rs2_40951 [Raphanus sativus]
MKFNRIHETHNEPDEANNCHISFNPIILFHGHNLLNPRPLEEIVLWIIRGCGFLLTSPVSRNQSIPHHGDETHGRNHDSTHDVLHTSHPLFHRHSRIPSASTSLPHPDSSFDDAVSSDPFGDVLVAFIKWDLEVVVLGSGRIITRVRSEAMLVWVLCKNPAARVCGEMKMDDDRFAASMNVGVGSFSDRKHGRTSSIPWYFFH